MSLGVHRVVKSKNSSAYFVLRSFGNYLIYPDALTDFEEDLFKSKGGVYRQLIHDLKLISLAQVRLFKIFGSSAVLGADQKENDTDTMPLEFYGLNFRDPTVKFNRGFWGGEYWMMKQGKEKVVFLSPDHSLRAGEEGLFKETQLKDSFFDYFEKKGVSYLFFSEHDEKEHYISL